MSREEEIQEKAIQFVNESYMDIGIKTTHEASVAACQRMAEWCDFNPRKGLWDAEKVCDFIKNNCIFSAANSPVIVEFDGEELVRKLRKAMEESL